MTSSIEASPAISTHKTGISMLPLPGEDMKKTWFVNTMVMQHVFTNNALNQNKIEGKRQVATCFITAFSVFSTRQQCSPHGMPNETILKGNTKIAVFHNSTLMFRLHFPSSHSVFTSLLFILFDKRKCIVPQGCVCASHHSAWWRC